MNRFLLVILMAFLTTSCFRSSAMTRDIYDSIQVGMPIADIEAQAGEPRDIRSKGGKIDQYIYSERIKVQPEPDHFAIEIIYYIEVEKGVVVGKHMTTKKTPAYNILYETQPNFAAP